MRRHFINQWPEIHQSPLQLTNSEMASPHLVLETFFDRYDLLILRFRLQQWFSASLQDDDTNVTNTYDLYQEIQRLAEAAFLLHEAHKKEQLHQLDRLSNNPTNPKLQAAFIPEDPNSEEAAELYYKAPRIEEFAYLHPALALKEIFSVYAVSDILDELEHWKRVALLSECTQYEKADEREKLLDWLDHFPSLLVALDIIKQFGAFENDTVALPLPATITRDYESLYLSKDELSDPLGVIRDYFNQFSFKFSHRECWALFEAVIMDERDEYAPIRRFAAAQYRGCVAALDAAYRIFTDFLPPANQDAHDEP